MLPPQPSPGSMPVSDQHRKGNPTCPSPFDIAPPRLLLPCLSHSQSLSHPLTTHPPLHNQQYHHQLRPDSPTSLEDSLSESSVDTLSFDSTDSADADEHDTGVEPSACIDRHGPGLSRTPHCSLSAGNGTTALPSSVVRNLVAIINLPSASLTCNNNDSDSSKNKNNSSSSNISSLGSNGRNSDTSSSSSSRKISIIDPTSPALMMATPPLSPTRQHFVKHLPELNKHQAILAMSVSVSLAMPVVEPKWPNQQERVNAAPRTRAGSIPPPLKGSRPVQPLSRTPLAVMPPRIPGPHLQGQPASAWTALLPGVAPIKVHPGPASRQPLVTPLPPVSTEQRLHQQVPIVLAPELEAKLTMEMYSLFESLLPTEESHRRRTKLIGKIENIIHTEWAGQDIKVLPFGSTVNDLGTNTSDVDICILTSWLGLQGVEMLASVFRKHGLGHVFCVPEAKVPIVKLWDPELQLSCDMNINTQLGIMNSRMVRTYVAIDPRVRPFAMIIKHWARKRVLNDAANGGTISTYTWICMVINFLQMRSPPILPSLHDRPHDLSPDNQVINGNNTSFFSDLSRLEGYGLANKESLGGLLYAFFRKFAIEFDYDHHVVSVRHGCYLTKESKGWDTPGKHYRLLCVEEPFDTTRNLGNSCDMASSKGLKQEFRRALDILNHNGSLDQVCDQWVFPPSYLHTSSHSSGRAGTNGSFGNNNARAGRRYGNGFRPRRHGSENVHNSNDADAEGTGTHAEPFHRPRSASSSHSTNGRPERANNEKRPRSRSVSQPREGSLQTFTPGVENSRDAESSGVVTKALESAGMQPIVEEVTTTVPSKALDDDSAIERVSDVGVSAQRRPRKASIRVRDKFAESKSPGREGENAGASKLPSTLSPPMVPTAPTIPTTSVLPCRAKLSGKSHTNGEPSKSPTGQKNGRCGGAHRDGGLGGKTPRAAVELCLADIAKIVNKADPSLPTASVSTEADNHENRKKKGGKKNVLWSTNSNRGESRGNHPPSKKLLQDLVEEEKAKSAVVAAVEIDEAGPRLDSAGSKTVSPLPW